MLVHVYQKERLLHIELSVLRLGLSMLTSPTHPLHHPTRLLRHYLLIVEQRLSLLQRISFLRLVMMRLKHEKTNLEIESQKITNPPREGDKLCTRLSPAYNRVLVSLQIFHYISALTKKQCHAKFTLVSIQVEDR